MASSVEAVWKTVKEIKLDDIRKASLLPLKVALLGSEDEIVWMQEHFRGASLQAGDLRRAADSLKLFEAPATIETLKTINESTFACVSPGAAARLLEDGLAITVPVYTIGNEGEWIHFKREILDTRRDLHLALGRNFSGIRPDVTDSVVVSMACMNAEVAVVSGFVSKFPIPGIGPIYPGLAFGDTVILTKNQVMLAFRLAGACGLPIDLANRRIEVLSIIGGGLGWRTIARQAAGMVPSPVGIALKGAIAYAGTYAAGKAIAHLFDTGRRMGREEEKRLYKEAMGAGRAFVAETLSRFARHPRRFRRRSNQ